MKIWNASTKRELESGFAALDGRGGYTPISPEGAVLVQRAQEGVRVWKLAPAEASSP